MSRPLLGLIILNTNNGRYEACKRELIQQQPQAFQPALEQVFALKIIISTIVRGGWLDLRIYRYMLLKIPGPMIVYSALLKITPFYHTGIQSAHGEC